MRTSVLISAKASPLLANLSLLMRDDLETKIAGPIARHPQQAQKEFRYMRYLRTVQTMSEGCHIGDPAHGIIPHARYRPRQTYGPDAAGDNMVVEMQ